MPRPRSRLLREFAAPTSVGALCCLALACLAGCKERPDLAAAETASPAAAETASPAAAAKPEATPAPADAPARDPARKRPAAGTPNALRFVAYNLENWLTMDRFVDNEKIPQAPKPEEEKAACVRILARARPDVLGLCEIGTREDALDLQQRLKGAGLDLPHLHYTGGADEVRHLAMLSRLPLTPHDPGPLTYRLEGVEYGMQRGILDASVQAGDRTFRFLGVHLKSQREVEEGSQEQMRRNESHLLRRRVEQLLEADPRARIVVYGDFNDTRSSSAVRGAQGPNNSPQALTPLALKDSRFEFWTHHWDFQDVYSRFDYIMVSQSLRPEVDNKASCILDDKEWYKASDHRPVMAVFR